LEPVQQKVTHPASYTTRMPFEEKRSCQLESDGRSDLFCNLVTPVPSVAEAHVCIMEIRAWVLL
jgi:hypothetical protein